MSVGIVMPVWHKNEAAVEYYYKAVDSVFQHSPEARLITIDNGSPIMEDRNFIEVEIPVNLGFGLACNLGFEILLKDPEIEWIGQMNTDAELVEDSVSILIEAAKRHCLDVAMPEHYENCQHYGLDKADQVMGPKWRFGAFWLARRSAIELVRKKDGFVFDPRFEMCYFEDTDLWRRMEAYGLKIAGYRGTWVKHKGNASALPNMSELFLRNKALYEKKWRT